MTPPNRTEPTLMPPKTIWTDAKDDQIRRLRIAGATWDAVAVALGLTRWTVIERARRLGVRLRLAHIPAPPPDPERPCLSPGDPVSWGAITQGTLLEGQPYVRPSIR
jgi:hypothetical protein